MVRTATDLPSVSDPYWVEQTTRLMPFLSRPRNWPSLKAWAKRKKIKQELLRNIVAWAETHGLVKDFVDETKKARDRVHWQALDGWKQTLAELQSELG